MVVDLLEEIIAYIISNKLANKKDTDIFKDYSPKHPDNCVIVYEYAGSPAADWDPVSVRSVQIVVRDKSVVSAKSLSWKIFKILSPEGGLMTIGSRKVIVANRNTPIKIGVDESGRNLVAFNLGITTIFD